MGRGEERRGEIITRNGMNGSGEANDTFPSHPLLHPNLKVVLAVQGELCAVGPATVSSQSSRRSGLCSSQYNLGITDFSERES